jgi:hypothetical protein
VAGVLLGTATAARAQIFSFTDEAAYAAKLAELGYASSHEGFECDATWAAARSPLSTASIASRGIKWTANHVTAKIITGEARAYDGWWGIYTQPHGDPTGEPFERLRDGFMGTTTDKLYGVGGWLSSNTGDARVRLVLDGTEVGFGDSRVTSIHKFFGVISTQGFNTFEIYETEGTVQDQEYIFGDDFTFGTMNACDGDLDNDGDVDGLDLFEFACVEGLDLAWLASDFGRTDCK